MRIAHATIPLFVLASLAACGRSSDDADAPSPPPGAENPALGLRLATLPEGVQVTVAEGPRWSFSASAGKVQGTATLEVVPTDSAAVNLVAEAKRHGEAAAAAAGGKFFGGNEMVTQYGPAYTVRVLVDHGLVEERAVFLLHPDGSGRLVALHLRYPPGDAEGTRARMLQAIELLGALEPLAAAAPQS